MLLSAGVLASPRHLFTLPPTRKFKMSLNAGAIGAKFDQMTLVEMAVKYGYDSVVSHPEEITAMTATRRSALQSNMKDEGISWGSGGLTVDFRRDTATFREGLANLPAHAEALESVGATRMNTWIMPSNADFTYHENFELHQTRLKDMANILGHFGIRLGLEYVGPKTLLTRNKYSFIRTMKECKELIAAIDESNVGFVLDSFHWYCAGDDKADLLTLENKDIITVDLNDARVGLTLETQIDGKRELPLATGVIPLQDFMDALVQIGYDGPVRAEPFNQKLRDMEDEEAVKVTKEAMTQAFGLIE